VFPHHSRWGLTAGSGLLGRVWPPVEGKRFVDPAVWPEIDEARQNVGQISLRRAMPKSW
jgi:hypothetical protein